MSVGLLHRCGMASMCGACAACSELGAGTHCAGWCNDWCAFRDRSRTKYAHVCTQIPTAAHAYPADCTLVRLRVCRTSDMSYCQGCPVSTEAAARCHSWLAPRYRASPHIDLCDGVLQRQASFDAYPLPCDSSHILGANTPLRLTTFCLLTTFAAKAQRFTTVCSHS
jgi:hypothetical protein